MKERKISRKLKVKVLDYGAVQLVRAALRRQLCRNSISPDYMYVKQLGKKDSRCKERWREGE